MVKREGFEEESVEDAEDGGVPGDSEREHRDHHQAESRLGPHGPQGDSYVVHQSRHETSSSFGLSQDGRRRPGPAGPAHDFDPVAAFDLRDHGGARLAFGESSADQFGVAPLQVIGQLVGDFAFRSDPRSPPARGARVRSGASHAFSIPVIRPTASTNRCHPARWAARILRPAGVSL